MREAVHEPNYRSCGRLVDIIVYRCAWAAQPADKEPQPVEFALQAAKTVCESLKDKFDSLKFYLTGKNNFRHEIAKILPYKGNRIDKPKPIHYQAIREYLIDIYKAEVVDGMEADDAIGIAQTDDTCIISIDKDLLQIPGKYYNWVKNERYTTNERDGYKRFYTQVLTGDRVDNIRGLDGTGPVGAKKLLAGLSSEKSMWQTCRYQWHHNYPNGVECHDGQRILASEAVVEVAKLLWISRAGKERWSEPS